MMYAMAALMWAGIALFSYGYSVTKHTFSDKDTCWGVSIQNTPVVSLRRKFIGIGGIMFGAGFVVGMVKLIQDAGDFETDGLIGFVVAGLVAGFVINPIAMYVGEKQILRLIETSDNALCLGRFEPIAVADREMEKAQTITIAPEGILLFDQTGFAFCAIRFADHSLGNLDNAHKMTMVSTYFMQKYPGTFKKKFDQNSPSVEMGDSGVANFAATGVVIAGGANGSYVNAVKLIKK